jgi:hypothetical protein
MRDYGEINTVLFDPAKIQIKEMEEALKNAQTYIRTVSPKNKGKSSDAGQ